MWTGCTRKYFAREELGLTDNLTDAEWMVPEYLLSSRRPRPSAPLAASFRINSGQDQLRKGPIRRVGAIASTTGRRDPDLRQGDEER